MLYTLLRVRRALWTKETNTFASTEIILVADKDYGWENTQINKAHIHLENDNY